MHFTDEELSTWREHGPGRDRDRVARHLQECGRCAARYADAIRTRPFAAADLAIDADGFRELGYAAAEPRRARVVRFPARRWLVSLAAAAAFVAAIVVPQLLRKADDGDVPRFRGTGLNLVTAEGTLDRRTTFVWSSGLDADRFRVEFGQGERIVYSVETTMMRLPMPAALWPQLQPGVGYWWSVTALDRSGQALAASSRRTFSIQGQ